MTWTPFGVAAVLYAVAQLIKAVAVWRRDSWESRMWRRMR
jgi:uncharacterized membrane protein (DUF2068 family)